MPTLRFAIVQIVTANCQTPLPYPGPCRPHAHSGARVAFAFLLLVLLLASAPTARPAEHYVAANLSPPTIPREFRGTWIATVSNIDWPPNPGLTVAEQQQSLLLILDHAARLHLNAVILQIRPACDALYASPNEPWSEYLTGQMGKAPEPLYDPLAFAVQNAHARGLELHAWFNPFRARHNATKSEAAPTHISRTQPRLVRTYGKQLWLDPGEHDAIEHSIRVILDVLRRYDIDGVHLDDYFYPYKTKDAAGQLIDFPDNSSWQRYQKSGGALTRDDWRRHNINGFIERLYNSIKSIKPWVKFGLSPFGIWKSGQPEQIRGLEAYDHLYADSRKWLASGWVDYFSPQLYWSIDQKAQSYPVLLKWWTEQNLQNRHLWPGNNAARVGTGWAPDEIVKQIQRSRGTAGVTGNVLWSVNTLTQNRGKLGDTLVQQVYSQRALVPASPWLGNTPPPKPRLIVGKNLSPRQFNLHWEAADHTVIAWWILQARAEGRWASEILPGTQTSRVITRHGKEQGPEFLAVTAVDRFGNTSPAAVRERVTTR